MRRPEPLVKGLAYLGLLLCSLACEPEPPPVVKCKGEAGTGTLWVGMSSEDRGLLHRVEAWTGDVRAEWELPFPPRALALGNGGWTMYLADPTDHTLYEIEPVHGYAKRELEVGEAFDAAYLNPSETELWLSTAGSERVTVVDLKSFEIARTIPGVIGPVLFSPDGAKAFARTPRGNVALLSPGGRTVARFLDHLAGPGGLALSHRGDRLFKADRDKGFVYVLETETFSVRAHLTAGLRRPNLVASTDRLILVADDELRSLHLFDAETLVPRGSVSTRLQATYLSLTPNCAALFLASDKDSRIVMVGLENLSRSDRLHLPYPMVFLAWSPLP